MKNRLILTFFLLILLTSITWAAKEPVIFDFEDPQSPMNEVWKPCELDAGSQDVTYNSERFKSGKLALKIAGKLPAGFGVTYLPWQDWLGYTKLSFDLYIPASLLKSQGDCWLYLKDKNYLWYETSLFKDAKTGKLLKLKGDTWNRFEIDISSTATHWRPGGHKAAWVYALQNPREFGLRIFGKKSWQGAVYLDNVKLSGEEPVLGARDVEAKAVKLRSLTVQANTQQVPVYEKLELTFAADVLYDNPFDPEVVDVQGIFFGPDGKMLTVPGFFYQTFERSKSAEGFEQLNPLGKPVWKVRFAPTMPGKWIYEVTLADSRGIAQSQKLSFEATKPLKPQGFVRVSKQDAHYFEYDNGKFYWPLGINMRDGGDDASKQLGTYDFDNYFKRFNEEGLDFVRMWMCAWWTGIEWSDEYYSRYEDIGRYNLWNAWRMDYTVDLAREYDINLEVTLNSHGQLRRDKFDEEWTYSPMNPRNGGYMGSPAMFFTDEQAKKEFKNRYRYLIARWGYSRNIMSWDLWNEVDLSEGYTPDEAAKWHQEMASYLKSIDPWKHLVETHICLFWSFGDELWRLPEIDAVQSDAYWDQDDRRMDMGMLRSYMTKVEAGKGNLPRYDKPFVFIEYGPLYTAVAAKQVDSAAWRSRFRTGMWTSAVMPTAAPGMFWYHKEWDQEKLWKYQKPMMELFGNLDRRGKDFRLRNMMIQNAPALRGVGMANETEGYFYVHNPAQMGIENREGVPAINDAKAQIGQVQAGTWRVIFYDTLTAQETGRVEVEVVERRKQLQFTLPPVVDDLLMKIEFKPLEIEVISQATPMLAQEAEAKKLIEKSAMSFAILADLHVTDEASIEIVQRGIAAINRLKPDFVVFAGDLTQDATPEAYVNLRKSLTGLKVPGKYIAGNHDSLEQIAMIIRDYDKTTETSNLNYYWDYNDFRLIFVNSVGPSELTWGGNFTPETIAWLEQTLAQTPMEKPIILLSHHGIHSDQPYMPRENCLWDVENWETVHKLLEGRNVVMCVHGHAHTKLRQQWGDRVMLWTTALSSTRENFDGSAPGFHIVGLTGNEVEDLWLEVPKN